MALIESNDQEIQTGGISELKPKCFENRRDYIRYAHWVTRSGKGSNTSCKIFTFVWVGGAENNVHVAGEFDDWRGTVRLERQGNIYIKKMWILGEANTDISFKFIVDGEWKYCPAQPQTTDERHITNNVLGLERRKEPEVVVKSSVIHEFIIAQALATETSAAVEGHEAKRRLGGIPGLFWWLMITMVLLVVVPASLVAMHSQSQKLKADAIVVEYQGDSAIVEWFFDMASVAVWSLFCSSKGSGCDRKAVRLFDIDCSC